MGPRNKTLNFIFPTKYVVPKSLKFIAIGQERCSQSLKFRTFIFFAVGAMLELVFGQLSALRIDQWYTVYDEEKEKNDVCQLRDCILPKKGKPKNIFCYDMLLV